MSDASSGEKPETSQHLVRQPWSLSLQITITMYEPGRPCHVEARNADGTIVMDRWMPQAIGDTIRALITEGAKAQRA